MPRKLVNLLDAKHVDLVVNIEATDVFSVTLDDIDELIDGRVFAEEHLGVVDAVLCGVCTSVQGLKLAAQMRKRTVQDAADKLLVHVRERNGAGKADAASLVPFEVHLRRRPVQADAHSLELARENGFVVLRLGGVKDLRRARLRKW